MTLLKLFLTILMLSTILSASEQTPTQEEVTKLYVATFNRAPDAAGLAYWTNDSFGGNPTLSGIAQSFFDQPETQTLYPSGTSYRDFIQSVYANLFNREPDSAGWDYWENELTRGAFSRNSFILAVINGALDNDDGLDKTILDNKKSIGNYYSGKGLNDLDLAKEVMIVVNETSQSIDYARAIIDRFLEGGENIELTLSYPQNSNILVHFVQTNANVQCDYILENEEGESEWSGTLDGVRFSITFIDDLLNKATVGNSSTIFTYNQDDTFNYQVYLNGEFLVEEYNIPLSSMENDVIARMIRRSSAEECEEKKRDIATLYKLAMVFLMADQKRDIQNFEICMTFDGDYNVCHAKWPDAYKSLEYYMHQIIFFTKPLAVLLDDYKSSCLEITTDEDNDGYPKEEGDCRDNDSTINPGAVEICNDQLDNDCDAYIDCEDQKCTSDLSCQVPVEEPSTTDIIVTNISIAGYSGSFDTVFKGIGLGSKNGGPNIYPTILATTIAPQSYDGRNGDVLSIFFEPSLAKGGTYALGSSFDGSTISFTTSEILNADPTNVSVVFSSVSGSVTFTEYGVNYGNKISGSFTANVEGDKRICADSSCNEVSYTTYTGTISGTFNGVIQTEEELFN